MTCEEKPITNYPEYTIDNFGVIKRNGRKLKQFFGQGGYCRVDLSNNGIPISYGVAKLVASHFLIPDPNRHLIDHINGNKHDNRACNLRYCTPSENNCNRKSKGYSINKKGKYVAHISKNRVRYTKTFDDKWRAIHWRICKEIELFGQFARKVSVK